MNTAAVLKIIETDPGISGFGIHQALVAVSRSARWFGRDSVFTALFGPGSASLYVSLNQLECDGLIYSKWGIATAERGGHRPRHYYARRGDPLMQADRVREA